MADALAISLRPVQLKLVATSTSADTVADSVRDILIKVEILARGHERLASAMQSMQGTLTVGFKGLMDGMQQISVGAEGRAVGAPGDVAQMLALVGRVKLAFREDEKTRILYATRSGEVCINTGRTWMRLIKVVTSVRGVERDAARDWLLTTIHLPARRDAQVLVAMRACVPILRAKPHLMRTLKDIVCCAFLKGIGVNREDLTNDLSRLWMDNNAYMASEMGLPSMVGGLGDMVRFLGGGEEMIKEPATVGGRPIIHCLMGHFALACCFVRSMLGTKAGIRPRRRSGIGNGVFDQWETEMLRVDDVLPRDNEVHHGLLLKDGADPSRAFVAEVDDSDEEGADAGAAVYPAGAVEDPDEDDDDGVAAAAASGDINAGVSTIATAMPGSAGSSLGF